MVNGEDAEIVSWFGDPEEAIALARAQLAENPDAIEAPRSDSYTRMLVITLMRAPFWRMRGNVTGANGLWGLIFTQVTSRNLWSRFDAMLATKRQLNDYW